MSGRPAPSGSGRGCTRVADYTPIYGKSQTMTFTAGAAIVGGNAVGISANDTVVPTAINATNFIGIAGHDAASGLPVTVHMGAGVVHETPAGVAFPAAGVPVYAAAAGLVSPTAGTTPVIIGINIRTALVTAIVRWKAIQ
jgi:hypothetical protein